MPWSDHRRLSISAAASYARMLPAPPHAERNEKLAARSWALPSFRAAQARACPQSRRDGLKFSVSGACTRVMQPGRAMLNRDAVCTACAGKKGDGAPTGDHSAGAPPSTSDRLLRLCAG